MNTNNPYNKIADNKIKACGYCRFSSTNQREESIEAQQRLIREYSEKNGYEIIEWYIDRAFSGKTADRPDFQRMLKDISNNDCPYKAIIVHKLDRLTRNAADALQYKELLNDYGISLISTVERIGNDPSGKLLFGIMSNINSFYLDNLSTEIYKGMKENAYQKRFNGGTPPLGYNIVNGKYSINEAEAIIVRKIFSMSAEGYGYNTIIKELNNCGYKTKAGNNFGKNSIYDLLRNERYMGIYTFNKRAKRSSQNKRNGHKWKDESEIIRFEDGCPAIVSKQLWERANASRKMTGKITTNAKYNYLLSGLLYCGECGAKLHGNHRKYGTYAYNTYRCNKQANQLTCSCKEIRSDVLEEFVISNLTTHFFNPDVIDIITDEVNKKIQTIVNADTEDIQHAKNALQGLKLARNNLVEAIAQLGFNKTLSDKLNAIEKQISEYEEIISDRNRKTPQIAISKEEVTQKIEDLKQFMLNPQNVEKTKLLLQTYIDKIIIDNHSVKVIFKIAFSFYYDGIEQETCYTYTVSEHRKVLKTA